MVSVPPGDVNLTKSIRGDFGIVVTRSWSGRGRFGAPKSTSDGCPPRARGRQSGNRLLESIRFEIDAPNLT